LTLRAQVGYSVGRIKFFNVQAEWNEGVGRVFDC
jgi:hypothetical protein